MASAGLLPWWRMWDFVSACGLQPDLQSTFRTAAAELARLVPSEHSFAIFLDFPAGKAGPVASIEHCNLPADAPRLYCERWFREDVARTIVDADTRIYHVDWTAARFRDSPITREYVSPILKIRSLSGLPFQDPMSAASMSFGLTRTGTKGLEDREESILLALRPHLENFYRLHRRAAERTPIDLRAAELARESKLLSRREAEVAALLCKRLRPAEIATLLLISPRTVERHVENIYLKLNVRSRKELITELLGTSDRQGIRIRPR